MSKSHRRPREHAGRSGPSDSGSGSGSLATGRGPKTVSDLGMETLNWAARELGVPMGMIITVLEQDPSLIEGIANAAKGPSQTGKPPSSSAAPQTDSTPSESTIPGLLIDIESPHNRLFIPEARPLAAQIPGSQSVRTPGMFTIEMAQYDIRIYNSSDQQITRIWGDPHVNENGGGDNWHFGNDSTFVLTDGTKVCLDTEKNSNDEWVVHGIDIIAGNDRYHFGTGGEDGLHKDAFEWDKENADVAAGDDNAGMFALKPDGTWAMQGQDGHFYDVKDESWGEFQNSNDVDMDDSQRVEITELQSFSVLYDHLPDHAEAPRGGDWDQNTNGHQNFSAMELKVPNQRPSFLKHSGSSVVQSPMGYTVEMQGREVIIYDLQGKQITRIWGDPHVNEKEGGDNWHFGGNSTFILPDGTKIRCDTKPLSANFWVVDAVDVVLGSSRFHFKASGASEMLSDGQAWDRANADADKRDDAGIFALGSNGEWAVMGRDGYFYDITDETWAAYQSDPDVDLNTVKRVEVTAQQDFAARADQLPEHWMMPALGQTDSMNEPTTQTEKEVRLQELAKTLPASHIQIVQDKAPGLLPGLVEDPVLARFIADMPVETLRLLAEHAPGMIATPPTQQPPKGALWPRPGMGKRPDPWWKR